jgi:nucleoside-diphosphate-sugar epimerase
MSRVLLTGAGGFIGAHAIPALLASGHDVHAVSRTRGEGPEDVSWHRADLLAEGAARELLERVRPELLLHLAWYATPGSFWTAPENELWVGASVRLLRAFGESGGRRAVMAGTCAEYAWGGETLDEMTTPLQPATLYGACKHATHVVARAGAEQLGVSLAWARIFFLYGPGEPPGRLVSSLARGLLAGERVPTSSGEQRRDFMHVEDVARGLAALLDSDVRGAVNIASGAAVPVREIVELLGAATGGSGRLAIGELAAREGEPAVIAGSSRRLNDEVGFRPRVELERGIGETVEWWRNGG